MISAEPIDAVVVDETGAPLADVAVVASWQLQGGMEAQAQGELTLLETTTDRDGRFHFAAWGPKAAPLTDSLHNQDPALYFFKPGYEFLALSNKADASWERVNRPERKSEWNGQRIVMPKVESDLQSYADRLAIGGMSGIRTIAEYEPNCEWKKIPIMLTRLNKERIRLEGWGLYPSLPKPELFANQKHCGSALQWMEGISK